MSTASAPTASAPAAWRRWLPFVGAAALVSLFVASTDRAAVLEALGKANLPFFMANIAITALLVWAHDAVCLVWLVRATLGGSGRDVPVRWRDMAALKAASYVLNLLNYHAASMGMAWFVSKKKGVSFLEGAGALATLSWLDLLTVTCMAVAGLFLSPAFFAELGGLRIWLQTVAAAVLGMGLLSVVLLQSGWQLPLLVRLRNLAPLRPIARLGPLQMLTGLGLRAVLMGTYTVSTFLSMQAFGLQPQLGHLLLAVPIVTIVGTIPISVSGYGSTQVLMRSLYAPFLAAGATTAVIDAWSTANITTFIVLRMILAAPFVGRISRELREGPTRIG